MDAKASIREERAGDVAGVRAVHDAAFGCNAEGLLVDRLRSDGLIVASVVALVDDGIIANAVFSELAVMASAGSIKTAALAPVAVMPYHQRRGLGARVVAHGLRLCAERGYELALVLGEPEYYTKFGFSPEIARRISSPYSAAGNAWMALELRPPSVQWETATAIYPAAFSAVD